MKDPKTAREDEVVNLISSIMDPNNQTANKIASVQQESTKGEVAEFLKLLRLVQG